jgi:hypothetical protein
MTIKAKILAAVIIALGVGPWVIMMIIGVSNG